MNFDAGRVPRTRGDEPDDVNAFIDLSARSPHTRG